MLSVSGSRFKDELMGCCHGGEREEGGGRGPVSLSSGGVTKLLRETWPQGIFFFPAVKHCGKWDKGEVLTVFGFRWLTRLWLWLYHQMRQAVEMLTRSQVCQVQHFSHSLSRLQVKASSQNTVALSSHCTPTGDHCTPLKETFFHTVPGGPHLLSSLTVYSFGNRRTLLLPVSDEAVLARRSDFFQLLFYFIFDGINR